MFKDIKKFFADFINNMRSKRSYKYAPLIAIPCLLAILIPTIFAVWQVYFKDEKAFDTYDVTVTLYNSDGKTLATETAIDSVANEFPLISMFTTINSGKELSTRPEDCIAKPNYKLYIDTGMASANYDCYFSSDPNSSYIYSDGKYFPVSIEPYTKFLTSAYSEATYSSATPPTLLTKQGEIIIPNQVNWRYKNFAGDLKQAKEAYVTAQTQNFEMSGSISLEFSQLPSVCSVKVSDTNRNLLYEGDIDRLSYITAEPGSLLFVDITANWARTEDCLAYGVVDYSFTVICKNYASFEISTNEICPGEFVMISASNIEQGSEVIYTPTSEKSKDIDKNDASSVQNVMAAIIPTISYSGDNAYALLPVPYGTPSGEFSFTIASGAASREFTVTVKDAPTKNEVTLAKSKKVINNAISSAALAELDRVMSDISFKRSNTIFFRGEFTSPDESGFTRGFSYGDHFVIGGEINEKYASNGIDYVATEVDANVYSLNVGRVVYVGYILHLGNFVVVDHGMGIATWYCHLSTFDCAVGDVLAKGEAVGKCGDSIFLEDRGMLLLCSLNDHLIDPDLILGKELLKNETQVSGGNNNDVQ